MMEADQDGDGKLSFDEFKEMVASTDIAKQMVRPHAAPCLCRSLKDIAECLACCACTYRLSRVRPELTSRSAVIRLTDCYPP